jgi:hypothetical protein
LPFFNYAAFFISENRICFQIAYVDLMQQLSICKGGVALNNFQPCVT